MKLTAQTIGSKLKEVRKSRNFTQKELAKKLGCTEIMISRYELGVSQLSISRLLRISEILNVPAALFLEPSAVSIGSTSISRKPFKKSFVFDLDDTLVDGRQFCGETIARVITSKYPAVNFDLICKLHESLRGMTIEDLYINITKEIGIKAEIPELLEQDRAIQEENINRMAMFDGVTDILDFLKSNSKQIYLCTNRIKPLLVDVLRSNGISHYFDEVISCIDAGYKKPNPYCLVDLIKRSGNLKDDFIYFGDSEIDCQFAENAGIDHIIFDQYLNNKNLFKKLVNMFLERQMNNATGSR
jgi:phosphoglycolate phosphatase-like HAD superfamily hydrolase/DNA-binding Xre family transcriptional regulator